MDYKYKHNSTIGTTGFFSCEPSCADDFHTIFACLEKAPFDDFLHLHILRKIAALQEDAIHYLAIECSGIIADFLDNGHQVASCPGNFLAKDLILAALLAESAILAKKCRKTVLDAWNLTWPMPVTLCLFLSQASPAIHLRAVAMDDHKLTVGWSKIFNANINAHAPLPCLDKSGLDPLFASPSNSAFTSTIEEGCETARNLRQKLAEAKPLPRKRIPAQETFLVAMDALMEADLLAGQEMRHEASLAPVALLRSWNLKIKVENGRNSHSLTGTATAYGRGFSLAQARASCAMEIVERSSAYVSVEQAKAESHNSATISDSLICGKIVDRKKQLDLVRASVDRLRTEAITMLAPESLPIEAPFPESPLHWVTGTDVLGNKVLVPTQAVFLFCNLDEQNIFLAGGSTGLASGNTMSEAKLSGLTEIIERDSLATIPFNTKQCFVLQSRDNRIQALLNDYADNGIAVQFQDITTELGIPAYKCFVMDGNGEIVFATGAGLDGRRAAMSALTETPWPYSPMTGRLPRAKTTAMPGLPVRWLEDLPDLSLSSPEADLALVESILTAHKKNPVYVDLTRNDLDIPVVRAIVPGLELFAIDDDFSSPSQRLFDRAFLK